ncbi:MAG: Crp/Fnr family transcriptional regulator [Candidatus Latescibacteria bacterium]|nr:Crp/Fnr family transcriptional regulator [Candidatus Latescibacterota bacterium]
MEKQLLRRVSLFSGLKEDELDALAEVTARKTFQRHSVILLAEEEGNSLFIIQKGRVKVSILSEDGREIVLTLLGDGEFFGEMSLLDGLPRSATVIALEDTEALMLRREDLLRLIERTPQIAIKLMAELTIRLRKTDQKIESLALLDVAGRIASAVLQLASDEGEETPEGLVIYNHPTQQLLANMTGSTRETVSRVLKRFRKEGYMASKGRNWIIFREEDMRREFLF